MPKAFNLLAGGKRHHHHHHHNHHNHHNHNKGTCVKTAMAHAKTLKGKGLKIVSNRYSSVIGGDVDMYLVVSKLGPRELVNFELKNIKLP